MNNTPCQNSRPRSWARGQASHPTNPRQASHFTKLSDSELYTLCKNLGRQALTARRQFAGTLPEVQRRRLHKRRSFTSIYEFAAKLAGMSQRSVDTVLRIARKVADKPALMEQLESGSQGWSKIERVAYIATTKTAEEWAEKVETLSKDALGLCVKEFRGGDFTKTTNEDLFTPGRKIQPEKFTNTATLTIQNQTIQSTQAANFGSLPTLSTLSFKVSPKLEEKFRLFKQQLEKQRKETISFAEVLEALLDGKLPDGGGHENASETTSETAKSDKTIPADAPALVLAAAPDKKIQIQICPECIKKQTEHATGRSIPISSKRLIHARHQGICAFPNCHKPATSLHHTQRFALEKSHNPDKIVPLCTAHERLAHAGLIANEDGPPETWKLQWKRDLDTEIATSHYKSFVDQMVRLKR